MESRAKALGHPIHPMLIVFPLGLLGTAVLFDMIQFIDRDGAWSLVAYYMIGAGVVFGLLAAVFGFRDWMALPDSRAKRIGAYHGALNVVVTTLFIISWFLRTGEPANPDGLAVILGIAGLLVSVVSGWLGGELVYRLRVGVDEGAHLNASSSLTDHQDPSSKPMPTEG